MDTLPYNDSGGETKFACPELVHLLNAVGKHALLVLKLDDIVDFILLFLTLVTVPINFLLNAILRCV